MYTMVGLGCLERTGIEFESLTQSVGHFLGPAVWHKLFVATCHSITFHLAISLCNPMDFSSNYISAIYTEIKVFDIFKTSVHIWVSRIHVGASKNYIHVRSLLTNVNDTYAFVDGDPVKS